ncbi:hypothetical protein ACFWY6_01795 [Streptomyces sp. NPDC059037]|uniref:hypothetical protein n=1 Tax=Streptomyces sp. NPDC059037 TaxID=3346710 RepID=UPI00367D3792
MARPHPGERPPDDESGLPLPALPALPAFPGIAGYGELHATIRKLGFRHAADALRAPAPRHASQATQALFGTLPKAETDDGFRVLDGLWFPRRGGLWQRVDLAYVQESFARWHASGDARGMEAAAVVAVLTTVLQEDPMGLRRLVLWELCCRLTDDAAGHPVPLTDADSDADPPITPPTADEAAALGVHRSEAGRLAGAAGAHGPGAGDAQLRGAGAARHAAETLSDIWPSTRLREAERLAAWLPAHHSDHVLDALLDTLRARSAAVDHLMDQAVRSESCGDFGAAASAWLGALRQARDDRDAQAGLLRTATRLTDDPFAPEDAEVTAAVDERTVRLTWRAPRRDGTSVAYRVLRFPDGRPEIAVEVSAHGTARTVVDRDAPVGQPLRYAVFPLLGERLAGVPRVTAPVLLAPDVTELSATAVPDGVTVTWRRDPAAAEVSVVRMSQDGDNTPDHTVSCRRDRLVDTPLPAGLYVYEVRCGYPGPDGGLVLSPGVRVTARAERWPAPVEELTVQRLDGGGRVRVAWRPPVCGDGHLVPWTERPVPPGADVSGIVPRLPAPGSAPASVDMRPPPGRRVRLTAVSVLGERAVSGASVVIEHPGEVRDLAVRRLADDRAELRFTWPEPAVLALVAWEDGERRDELRVARSRHVAGRAVTVPVSAGECRFTVGALPRPDAVTIEPPPARAILPPAPPPAPPAPVRWWRTWWHRRRRRSP